MKKDKEKETIIKVMSVHTPTMILKKSDLDSAQMRQIKELMLEPGTRVTTAESLRIEKIRDYNIIYNTKEKGRYTSVIKKDLKAALIFAAKYEESTIEARDTEKITIINKGKTSIETRISEKMPPYYTKGTEDGRVSETYFPDSMTAADKKIVREFRSERGHLLPEKNQVSTEISMKKGKLVGKQLNNR